MFNRYRVSVGKIKKFWRCVLGDSGTIMEMKSMPLNYTLKNGLNSYFCVILSFLKLLK